MVIIEKLMKKCFLTSNYGLKNAKPSPYCFMKICIVLSTRPEIIKLSPLVEKFKENKDNFYLINTNQHSLKKMSKIFFDFFKIKGKVKNINPSKKSQSIFFPSLLV